MAAIRWMVENEGDAKAPRKDYQGWKSNGTGREGTGTGPETDQHKQAPAIQQGPAGVPLRAFYRERD
jgi:hypothetical protein